MKWITAIIRPARLNEVRQALLAIGVEGATVTEVEGFGRQRGHAEVYPGMEAEVELLPKVMLEVGVKNDLLERALGTIIEAAYTGKIGDGKIIVCDLEDAVRVSTGESGDAAL